MSKKKGQPTNRRRFMAWIESELARDGAAVTQPVRYQDIQQHIERTWLLPARSAKSNAPNQP